MPCVHSFILNRHLLAFRSHRFDLNLESKSCYNLQKLHSIAVYLQNTLGETTGTVFSSTAAILIQDHVSGLRSTVSNSIHFQIPVPSEACPPMASINSEPIQYRHDAKKHMYVSRMSSEQGGSSRTERQNIRPSVNQDL